MPPIITGRRPPHHPGSRRPPAPEDAGGGRQRRTQSCYRRATATVFGEGSVTAAMTLVGEQASYAGLVADLVTARQALTTNS